MTDELSWVGPVAGAVASGAVGGGVVAIFGQAIQGGREHRRWVREMRFQAYSDALTTWETYWYRLNVKAVSTSLGVDDMVKEMQGALARVTMVGPSKLRPLAVTLHETVVKALDKTAIPPASDFLDARNALVVEMHKLLKFK